MLSADACICELSILKQSSQASKQDLKDPHMRTSTSLIGFHLARRLVDTSAINVDLRAHCKQEFKPKAVALEPQSFYFQVAMYSVRSLLFFNLAFLPPGYSKGQNMTYSVQISFIIGLGPPTPHTCQAEGVVAGHQSKSAL